MNNSPAIPPKSPARNPAPVSLTPINAATVIPPAPSSATTTRRRMTTTRERQRILDGINNTLRDAESTTSSTNSGRSNLNTISDHHHILVEAQAMLEEQVGQHEAIDLLVSTTIKLNNSIQQLQSQPTEPGQVLDRQISLLLRASHDQLRSLSEGLIHLSKLLKSNQTKYVASPPRRSATASPFVRHYGSLSENEPVEVIAEPSTPYSSRVSRQKSWSYPHNQTAPTTPTHHQQGVSLSPAGQRSLSRQTRHTPSYSQSQTQSQPRTYTRTMSFSGTSPNKPVYTNRSYTSPQNNGRSTALGISSRDPEYTREYKTVGYSRDSTLRDTRNGFESPTPRTLPGTVSRASNIGSSIRPSASTSTLTSNTLSRLTTRARGLWDRLDSPSSLTHSKSQGSASSQTSSRFLDREGMSSQTPTPTSVTTHSQAASMGKEELSYSQTSQSRTSLTSRSESRLGRRSESRSERDSSFHSEASEVEDDEVPSTPTPGMNSDHTMKILSVPRYRYGSSRIPESPSQQTITIQSIHHPQRNEMSPPVHSSGDLTPVVQPDTSKIVAAHTQQFASEFSESQERNAKRIERRKEVEDLLRRISGRREGSVSTPATPITATNANATGSFVRDLRGENPVSAGSLRGRISGVGRSIVDG